MNTFSRHRIRPAATSVSIWTLAVLVSCLALYQLWSAWTCARRTWPTRCWAA